MKWSEDNSVLTDAQFGFRSGYGTHDAIFALHSIISKSLRQGKRLYCCFIVHNITLNSLHNIGIRIVFPSKIYSFKILFTPGDLFRFIWSSGFRGDYFLEINQSETRIAWGGHVC
jgi:hypothetical protein